MAHILWALPFSFDFGHSQGTTDETVIANFLELQRIIIVHRQWYRFASQRGVKKSDLS